MICNLDLGGGFPLSKLSLVCKNLWVEKKVFCLVAPFSASLVSLEIVSLLVISLSPDSPDSLLSPDSPL